MVKLREGLKQPARETVRPEEAFAYDRVVGRQMAYGYASGTAGYPLRPKGEEAGPYFSALLQSPLIADHLSELGVIYRTRGEFPGSYEHKDREFVDIVLAQYLGFNMWGHIADGLSVGVRPEAILAVLGQADGNLTDDERRMMNYIRSFAAGAVSQDDWDYLEGRLGRRGAVEYTAFIGHLLMTIRIMQAVNVTTGDDAAPTDDQAAARVRDVMSGKEALPSAGDRIPKLEYEPPVQA